MAAEFSRYDAVVFLESASVSRQAINASMLEGGNQHRNEQVAEAEALDQALRTVWGGHPRFTLIPSSASFYTKIERSVQVVRGLLEELQRGGEGGSYEVGS